MKIFGKQLKGPNVESVYIPRGDDIIEIKAQAILDDSEFNKICPQPIPPKKMIPRQGAVPDLDDKFYKSSLDDYAKKRSSWIFIKSLEVTPGLEWEKVKLTDPNTWNLYREELIDSGFSTNEINIIWNCVLAANALDDNKLEEARKRFLAMRQMREGNLYSQEAEPLNTQSGVLVNGSV